MMKTFIISTMKKKNKMQERQEVMMSLLTLLTINVILQSATAPTFQMRTTLIPYVQMVVLHIVMVEVLQAAVVLVIIQDMRWIVMSMRPYKNAMT